jgi:D-aspartate ligase
VGADGALGGGAIVLGDLDLAVPLAAAGVDVTVVARRDDPVRFSRRRFRWIEDPRPDEPALVSRLVEAAATSTEPPTLFVEDDADLGFLLRHGDDLRGSLRFVAPPSGLVSDLLDKAAFAQLADRLELPVPPSTVVATGDEVVEEVGFPAILKPLGEGRGWGATTPFGGAKAVRVDDPTALSRELARLSPHYTRLLLQRLIDGPESRLESYHVYVDADGRIAAEFTGRKLRTHPAAYGFSTALVTTTAEDVRSVGRSVVGAIGLRGVAKVDLKRDPDGRLWLLEVNPRCNLWHHLGAAAGCNIPAVVHADLTGRPRPAIRAVPAGVTWAWLPRDISAARSAGVGLVDYARWLARCDAIGGAPPTDPWPFLRGRVWPRVRDARSGTARVATP